MSGTVLSYPIPLYANLPIESQFYQPNRFVISDISRGQTTTITTSEDHNFVVGQIVRIILPRLYGAYQLNEMEGMVTSLPTTTQVVLNINSSKYDSFVVNPITATITAATKAVNCVLTANNSFKTGNSIRISGVLGMTELNGIQAQIIRATSTTLTLDTNSSGFTTYISGGTATLVTQEFSQPQIIAVGDYNSGQTNSHGINSTLTYVPGSFINISPE